MKEREYIFSVVMSVYNVDKYLREAVESLVHQTIGFDKIQLILVDDGSTDTSGAICDEYREKYPENVMVLHKENGGLSSARNAGIPYVKGKYVSFFDPDDLLDRNVMEKVGAFMDAHRGEVDVCCIPYFMFGNRVGPHPLNNKFDGGTRVIDLTADENAGFILLSAASAFYAASAAKRMNFDTQLFAGEDAKQNLEILMERPMLGVVSDVRYHYRKHGNSTLDKTKLVPKWYLTNLQHYIECIMKKAMDRFGKIPRFVQCALMYDMQWRFNQSHIPDGVLSAEEADAYRSLLLELARRIDDDVILAQKNMSYEVKLFLLLQKNGGLPSDAGTEGLGWAPETMWGQLEKLPTYIHFMRFESGCLVIEGMQSYLETALPAPDVFVTMGGERELRAQEVRYASGVYSADVKIAAMRAFRASIPLDGIDARDVRLGFYSLYGEKRVPQREIVTKEFAPVSTQLQRSWYAKDGFLLRPAEAGFVLRRMRPGGALGNVVREFAFLKELMHTQTKGAKKAVACRVMYHLARPFCPKNIWLIMDKADRADDSGETFYKYLLARGKEAGCRPVFAIGRTSPEYSRFKAMGRVVPYLSWRHKLLHLLAQHTISPYSHKEISSPFFDYSYFYGDLLQRNKVVFLQHGITNNDVSNALNRYEKNYALFVTSVKPEWESVAYGNYGYSPDQVILTGLPRYDLLRNDPKKYITIMPTWLRSLCGRFIPEESRWELLPGFEQSDYYRMYSALLNDDRLLSAAAEMGYTIRFLIHPVFLPYVDRFKLDKRVVVFHREVHYRDVFAESALITTDYSSVAFDFAYLNKPVVYTQFTDLHYKRGYYDYEKDGFGEITHTVDEAVNCLIDYMKNGCQLKDKYRERIDKFFAFHDKNNCQRVYDAIMDLDKKG